MTNQNFDIALRKTAGVSRIKKLNLVIDMTPMVDLGFLLIAFFILTTQMNQPAVTKLYMPKESKATIDVGESRSMTILIGNDSKLYYYFGTTDNAIRNKTIFETNYSESAIGNLIRQKQILLGVAKDSLIILIKSTSNSYYKNLVDVLDEMIINNIKRYSIVDISKEEDTFLTKRN